jgi:ABC-type multidrug transport system fused ATPase/permease subunit
MAGDTQTFKRVLVVEEGRIVEDDSPTVLLARPERPPQHFVVTP